MQKIFENSNNYNYNYNYNCSSSKFNPSERSTGNNFNNTIFSAGMLHCDNNVNVNGINNNDFSRNFSIKLEIENIDKDIKILQNKLKSMIEDKNI